MPLRTLDERLRRRVTVLFEQTLFQTAAVDANADGDAALPAGLGHLADIVRLADVAGVDADLVHAGLRRCERKAVVKVDVGHDRDGRGVHDLGQGIRRGLIRHGKADDLAPGVMLHMDCTATGAPPPMATGPTWICFVWVLFINTPVSPRSLKTHKSPRRKDPPRIR